MRYSTEGIRNNRIVRRLRDRHGSSIVMLAIIFVGFAMCTAGAVGISRSLVLRSECETFGRLWTKAIMSEYDVHLLDDYSLMAYFGSDDEVTGKINDYLRYSAQGKLDASIKGANAELTGLELGDPVNFRKALRLGFAGSAAEELIQGRGRVYRGSSEDGAEDGEGSEKSIEIKNKVVIDTLPSNGSGGSISGTELTEKAKSVGDSGGLTELMTNAGAEILLIQKCFDNNVTKSDEKKHLFVNEWEYIIKGSLDDETNRKACRTRLFIARNALNLAALYRDPAKVELIVSAAEAITPGPLGILTQAILAEAWAVIETEEDLKALYSDGRVPVLKTAEQWKTGLGAVFDSSEVEGKLDEESKELLSEKKDELSQLGGASAVAQIREGLNYDEYLMIMILAMKEETRLLRIMDLVQINMKYRYYRDFNLMEYYTGTRFTIEAGRRSHVFEDAYK